MSDSWSETLLYIRAKRRPTLGACFWERHPEPSIETQNGHDRRVLRNFVILNKHTGDVIRLKVFSLDVLRENLASFGTESRLNLLPVLSLILVFQDLCSHFKKRVESVHFGIRLGPNKVLRIKIVGLLVKKREEEIRGEPLCD